MTAPELPVSGAKTVIRRVGLYRKAGVDLTERQRAVEWRAVDAEKQRAEVPILEWAREQFQRQEEQVLERLLEFKASATKAEFTVDELFDIGAWLEELEDTLPEKVLEAIRHGFETGRLRIDVDGTFDPNDLEIQRALRDVVEQTKKAPRTTKEDLRRVITEGLDEDETIGQIASRVKDVFEEKRKGHARTIAQTAGTSSFEAGQVKAFDQAGIDAKQWLSQRDSRVRRSHWTADGQTVPTGTKFEVGGAMLRFPGDPEGPADETINCRCTMLPVLDEN